MPIGKRSMNSVNYMHRNENPRRAVRGFSYSITVESCRGLVVIFSIFSSYFMISSSYYIKWRQNNAFNSRLCRQKRNLTS